MPCQIPYIPERLHSNGRENIGFFFIGEILHRRCPKDKVADPFGGISLVDLSVNRQGNPAEHPLCEPGDVLFNMTPDNEKGHFLDEAIVPLQIMELGDEGQYKKAHTAATGKDLKFHVCCICLKHKKEECNYSHAAFEIFYDGKELTSFEQYKNTLKKNSLLRTWCKTEISKMIIREEIWLNWPNNQ